MIASDRFISLYRNIFQGRSVIELGSGNGLVGILVSKLFQPTSVCMTDLDSHVEHISCNAQTNSCGGNVTIEALDWLTSTPQHEVDGIHAAATTYDIVLALEW